MGRWQQRFRQIKVPSQNEALAGAKIPDGLIKPDGLAKFVGPAKSDGLIKSDTLKKSDLSKIPLQHSREPLVKNQAEVPVKHMMAAGELFKQTAAGFGFPQDRLSVAILAFARFFSLQPNQALLASLRREFLASNKTPSPGNTTAQGNEKAALEAKVLALVSAMDKGAVLSSDALARYARFLAPEAFEDKDPSFPKGNVFSKGTVSRKGNAVLSVGGKGNKAEPEEIPRAEEIMAIAGEQAGEDDLLNFLNLMPGKNGQYWMVFPFSIKIKDIELKVNLRVLKREGGVTSSRFSTGESEFLIADITGPKKRWRCYVNKITGKFRADIRVYPACNQKALKALAKEAEQFLGKGTAMQGGLTGEFYEGFCGFSGFDEILVGNGDEIPSWMKDLCAGHLPSIDEEV